MNTCSVSFIIVSMKLMEQELLTLPEHLSSPPVFIRVRVTLSLVLCAMFCRLLFVLYSFFIWSLRCLSFSLNYGFWLPLWYLQTLLSLIKAIDEYLSRFNAHPTRSVNTMHNIYVLVNESKYLYLLSLTEKSKI